MWDLVGPRLWGGKAPDPLQPSVTQTIIFSDAVTFTVDRAVSASSTLTFSDSASTNTVVETASSTLSFTDSASFTVDRAVSAASTLIFSQSATGLREVPRSASNNLIFTDAASFVLIRAGVASSSLVFSDAAVGIKVVPVASTLTFTDLAQVQQILNLNASDTIPFTDSAYGTTGHLAPVCTNPLYPTLGIRNSFTFIKDLLVVDTRIPEFGNVQAFTWERVTRRTRGGQLSVSGAFSTKDVYKFSFRALSSQQRNDLENFFIVTAGQQITIIDHENSTFLGVVLSPGIIFTQEGIGCQFAFSFEFRGVKQ